MKTFSLLRTLKNDYIFLILVLSACYVLSFTTVHFFAKINYILIVFLFFIPRINEDTYIVYSLILGFFYDFIADGYLGVSVLFFFFLSLIWILFTELFDMTAYVWRLLFGLGVILLFNMFNMVYFGYKLQESIGYMFGMSLIDFVVFFVLYTAVEAKRVFA